MTDAFSETAGSGGKVRTRSLSVADRIRTAILSGEIDAGARLHEVKLSDSLGVSRTPVRAALQALSSEGLLDYTPNRGYSVRQFQTSEIFDAYEIRSTLEALAARFAAERGLTDAERTIIEPALTAGDELLAKPQLQDEDRISYGTINFAFHDAIHVAARCRMLCDMIRLCQSVPQSSHRNVVAFEHADVRRRHDDHHRIHEAIMAREPWRAEMLMREHVAGVKASLIKSLTERGRDSEPDDAVAAG
jgi:GntR family transcriptional regulator of vanillate catabolism